jgi:RDD family
MRCPRCQQNNDGSAEKCIFCGAVLTESVLVTGLPMDKRPVGSTTPTTANDSIAPLLGDLLKENPAIPPPRTNKFGNKEGLGVDELLQDSRMASWESLDRRERTANPDQVDDIRQRRKGDLPEWVYEVNYQNLPKKKGYVIFADENGIAFVTKCANPIRQFIALAIDAGVIFGAAILIYFATANAFFNSPTSTIKADFNLFIAVAAITTVLYFFLFRSRTLGNRLTWLKLVTVDGTRMAFQPAFTRGVYYGAIFGSLLLFNYIPFTYVILIPILLGVGYLTAFLPPDFRALPDRITNGYFIELDTMLVHGRDF